MDLTETKRVRRDLDVDNVKRVYGCYVCAGQIVARMSIPVLDLSNDEKEMYTKLFRKCISGRQDKNLLEIEMPDSDQQKALFALAGSELESDELREVLYEQIISNLEIDKNYCIILMADNYDVVAYDNDEDFMDKEGSTFNYFICGICPIKEAKAELRYAPNQAEFRETSTGSVMTNPMLGFMYPAYLDGDADIYKALYYTTKESHEELVKGLFGVDAPLTASEQKEEFHSNLFEVLREDYTLDTAAAVYTNIHDAEENEEEYTFNDLSDVLEKQNVPEDKVEKLREVIAEELVPINLVSKKYEIRTDDTVITTEPENALMIKTREIDGRKYILIPANGRITVNGQDVFFED